MPVNGGLESIEAVVERQERVGPAATMVAVSSVVSTLQRIASSYAASTTLVRLSHFWT